MAKLREILQPRDVLEESQERLIYFRSQDLERASCAHNAKRALYVEQVARQKRIEAIDLGSRLFFNPAGLHSFTAASDPTPVKARERRSRGWAT